MDKTLEYMMNVLNLQKQVTDILSSYTAKETTKGVKYFIKKK